MKIVVSDPKLHFECAHIVSFENRLDFVNSIFKMTLIVEGDLDEKGFVSNFYVAEGIMEELCKMYSYKIFLASKSQSYDVKIDKDLVRVYLNKRERYALPKENVILFPVTNTTTEVLAQAIGIDIANKLKQKEPTIKSVKLILRESPGFAVIYEKNFAS